MDDLEQFVRVFIVDDHDVVRLGLHAFIDEIPDIGIIGEAANGEAALQQLAVLAEQGEPPDVVLMDLVMRGLDGIATIAAIKQRHPQVEVVAVTSFGEVQRIHAALAAGAAGYVLKDADVNDILVAIRAAYRGEVHLDPATARTLTQSLTASGRGAASLTRRERDVLAMVAAGKSNREISRALVISERTVQSHLSSVLRKVGLASRTQAALWALKEGIATLEAAVPFREPSARHGGRGGSPAHGHRR
jgi:DNA-binding NarL/FixJ family response regulator